MRRKINFLVVISLGLLFISCKKESDANPISTPAVADYFPIKLGKIKFNYVELGGQSRQWLYKEGQVEWDVYNSYKLRDTVYYKVIETKSYHENTPEIVTKKTNFDILEGPYGHIIVKKELGISHQGGLSFNRYHYAYLADTLEFRWNGGYYKLKKDVGLMEIYDSCYGKDYWKLELSH